MFAAGCGGPLSTLDPVGPQAARILPLWWAMFWGALVLFLLVMALFALVYLRPGWGARISPMGWIVAGGLGLPALVLPPLSIYSLYLGERLVARPDADLPRIEAVGEMWTWNFFYPDHGGGSSVDILHLPAGEPVEVAITSADVIHSFWIPRLAHKLDAVPGHTNLLRIEADAPGVLEGVCAEFCGLGHADMRFEVRVHAPEDVAAAIDAAPVGAPPVTPAAPPLPEGLPPEPLR